MKHTQQPNYIYRAWVTPSLAPLHNRHIEGRMKQVFPNLIIKIILYTLEH